MVYGIHMSLRYMNAVFLNYDFMGSILGLSQ